MRKILGRAFFKRKTLTVAENLLGMYLVRRVNGKTTRELITEVEAYIGPHDLASHASKGRTARTEVMFDHPGTLYVYLIYGLHSMLNVVTEEKGYPSAILIRGTKQYGSPGVLTREFSIDRKLNGLPASKKTGLWFEDRGVKVARKDIKKTPRIGIDYAGPKWAKKKYRFVLAS